jgi:hypothetical protein
MLSHRLELPALPYWLSCCSDYLTQSGPHTASESSLRRTQHLATRIVPKNPISNVRADDKEDFDFLIAAPFAEKVTHKVAQLIREGKKFAVLLLVRAPSECAWTRGDHRDVPKVYI